MLAEILILTVIALLVPQLIPGSKVKGIESALLIAVIFLLLNLTVGFVLRLFLSAVALPFVFLTPNLLRFVVTVIANAVVLKITDAAMDSFELQGWKPAFVMGLIFAVGARLADWIV